MRRLTLILSDVYLPTDAAPSSFPTTLELPALQWLLRFADPPQHIAEWRSWLARDLGADPAAAAAPAHACARALGVEPAGCWLATPVRLEARLDHVRLADRGLPQVPAEQLGALAEEFRASFGPETLLASDNPRAMLLQGGPVEAVRTVDPARLLDADVGAALPSGPGAGVLRRLMAEIEMWLPGTRFNAGRARAGQPRVTSLWLWGGGPAVASSIPHAHGDRVGLSGGDPFLAALARQRAQVAPSLTPRRYEDLAGGESEMIVELAPLSGMAEETLQDVEARWLAPARDALASGRLDSLRLVANDRVFTVPRRAGWKWWRRRRGWLESLA